MNNRLDPIEIFTSYSREQKTDFLLRLAHELTIIARDTYDPGSDGLTKPSRLRAINEIQHRIISSIIALWRDNPNRYPDEVLLEIILDHPEDLELQQQLRETFNRISSKMVVA